MHYKVKVDGKIKQDVSLKEYSYAYYNNGKLANQYGDFVYSLNANDFKAKLRDFVFDYKEDLKGSEYSHLSFQPNQRKLIIVSKEVNTLLTELASVSFVFLILLLFGLFMFTQS